MESSIGQPYVPKGYKDIQYITDEGVKHLWYKALLEEHQKKSEANGTFEWIPDSEYEKLKKSGMPILRHVWVFKLKRDDHGDDTFHKARGCVNGPQQKIGVDYNEAFAPTCREDFSNCCGA